MSLNRSFWLNVASISSHRYKASDSQLFTYYEVNRLLTTHLETHFHLNVMVVYLPTNHWGWHSHFPSPNRPWLSVCNRLCWHAVRDLSVYILHLSLQLAHPCREHTLFFFFLQRFAPGTICFNDLWCDWIASHGHWAVFPIQPAADARTWVSERLSRQILCPEPSKNPVLPPCHVLQSCLLFFFFQVSYSPSFLKSTSPHNAKTSTRNLTSDLKRQVSL